MRSRHRLVGWIAALVGLTILSIAGATQGAGAIVVPKSDTVEVTGFGSVSASGSTGPVTVTLSHHQAAAVTKALAALTVTTAGVCHGFLNAFVVRFLPYKGARPTLVATEEDCPSPGVVSVTKHGRTIQTLRENCSLRAQVLAALPRGGAEGTRGDKRACSS
jgi:hypothetical protein